MASDELYSNWHRAASEVIVSATQAESQREFNAKVALGKEYGRKALGEAKTRRERTFTLFLIGAAEALQAVDEVFPGSETASEPMA